MWIWEFTPHSALTSCRTSPFSDGSRSITSFTSAPSSRSIFTLDSIGAFPLQTSKITPLAAFSAVTFTTFSVYSSAPLLSSLTGSFFSSFFKMMFSSVFAALSLSHCISALFTLRKFHVFVGSLSIRIFLVILSTPFPSAYAAFHFKSYKIVHFHRIFHRQFL